jgi:hypothetical protein
MFPVMLKIKVKEKKKRMKEYPYFVYKLLTHEEDKRPLTGPFFH